MVLPLSRVTALRPFSDTLGKGVPAYAVIDGVLGHLLLGYDNQPLKGFDGQYLYGVV